MSPLATEFWRAARRPRWVAVLLLALAVAAVFAALAQWQIERSVETAVVDETDTETVVPLDSLVDPRVPVSDAVQGRRVSVEGELDPDAYVVLTGRSGGAWLVGRIVTPDGASLAVALGSAADPDAVLAAAPAVSPTVWTGRYLPPEGPQESDFEAGERSALAIADLVNTWPADPDPAQVYGGYLVADDAPDGLTRIPAAAPEREAQLNLLNVFYAIEWIFFGGFAGYLWYRLVRDAAEARLEERDAEAPVD